MLHLLDTHRAKQKEIPQDAFIPRAEIPSCTGAGASHTLTH